MKLRFIFYILCLPFIVVSCKDDALYDISMSDRIVYNLGSGYNVEMTRSVECLRERFETMRSEKIVLGNDTVNFDFMMADCTSMFGASSPGYGNSRSDTSGDLIEDMESVSAESVKIHAFDGTESAFDEEIKLINGQTAYSSNNLWTKSSMSFASEIGIKDITWTVKSDGDGERLVGNFDYSVAKGYTSENESQDILVAIAENVSAGSPVNLNHQHPLSTVEFQFGTLPEGVTITSIEIDNIYTNGKCEFNLTNVNDSIEFKWTRDERYSNTTLIWTNPEKNVKEKKNPDFVRFFVIPQSTKIDYSKLRLYLRFTDGRDNFFINKELDKYVSALKPDVRYCFNIGIPSDVQLYISDNVDGKSKTNLTIANIGHGPGYLRFALLAYVTDADGNIVRSIDLDNFNNNLMNYNIEGFPKRLEFNKEDGYYYYLKPLDPINNTFEFGLIGDGTFLRLDRKSVV